MILHQHHLMINVFYIDLFKMQLVINNWQKYSSFCLMNDLNNLFRKSFVVL